MRVAVAIGAFLLIAGVLFMARPRPADEPERSRHEVVPLGDPAAPAIDERRFGERPSLPPPPPERPAPEPTGTGETEETDLDRLVEVLAGGPQEFQEEEIREAFEGGLDEAWEPAPDESAEEPAEGGDEVSARIREATRRRRQQSLDLVILLQDELAEELEAAQEAGDVDRVRWLSASARRLAVRRAALERALSGAASDRER